jgi:hypothetical protein
MTTSPLPEAIRNTIMHGRDAYDHILNDPSSVRHYQVEIDCDTLPEPIRIKGEPQNGLESFWAQLPTIAEQIDKKACLYYFEIVAPDAKAILEHYRSFMDDPRHQDRNRHTLKKRPPENTTILYVGKVKAGIGGRMMVHLGYYHVGATAGLQLVSWAKGTGLKLRLHVYAFNGEMRDFVDPLELPLARLLHPLIGKH